jgi:hypothetical protein
MLRYSRGIDRFDRDLVRSCYWDDAIDDRHNYVGTPDDFLDKYAWPFHGRYQTLHHHTLTNHTCELAGDEAHCETYCTFIGSNKEPPHMLSIGRYVDHVQKRGGEWKIAGRVCTIEAVREINDMPAYLKLSRMQAPNQKQNTAPWSGCCTKCASSTLPKFAFLRIDEKLAKQAVAEHK